MTNNEMQASLTGRTGEQIALKSVHVDGRLDGLMLKVRVRQSYRNETGNNLETVYTFPLAWGTTLLGLNVEIAGKRLTGTVIEKKEATERYEKAIDDGDTPVMVEKSASGLYTANLGNLKDGEDAVIEIEYAQLLRFEQGRIRLAIPTTIAPRYGDAHQQGGLAAHETAAVNPMAEYPFTLKLALRGPIAQASLGCPSHKVSIEDDGEGMTVTLDQGGMLDRDFILNLEDLAGQSFAVAGPDGDQHVVLASFCPMLPAQETAPLRLKILVDCSGSMNGDSIEQARAALHEVAQALTPADAVSYSKFGSKVLHVIPKLQACTPHLVGEVLARAIGFTEADLGGTEFNAALLSTFEIKSGATKDGTRDVLLITDGDVWDIDNIVDAAAKSGHRIFAVGVGSSPAESLLRDLAEKTGGACELVSPNEDISTAIVRMFNRMRAARSVQIQVDWGGSPVWQSALPEQLFDGETVHVFATFAEVPQNSPILSWLAEDQGAKSQPAKLDRDADNTVARLGGVRQLAEATTTEASLALALKYQLVSAQTNLFLLHVRAEDDKAVGLPQLQQIEQMQAAGWGGFGSARSDFSYGVLSCSSNFVPFSDPISLPMAVPSVWRTNRSQASARANAKPSLGMEDYENPAFLHKDSADRFELPDFLRNLGKGGAHEGVTPIKLIDAFNHAALSAKDFNVALMVLLGLEIASKLKKLVDAAAIEGGTAQIAWALLLDWLTIALSGQPTVSRHGRRLLKSQLAGIDEAIKLKVGQRFAAALPDLGPDSWGHASSTLKEKITSKVRSLVGSGGLKE